MDLSRGKLIETANHLIKPILERIRIMIVKAKNIKERNFLKIFIGNLVNFVTIYHKFTKKSVRGFIA